MLPVTIEVCQLFVANVSLPDKRILLMNVSVSEALAMQKQWTYNHTPSYLAEVYRQVRNCIRSVCGDLAQSVKTSMRCHSHAAFKVKNWTYSKVQHLSEFCMCLK